MAVHTYVPVLGSVFRHFEDKRWIFIANPKAASYHDFSNPSGQDNR